MHEIATEYGGAVESELHWPTWPAPPPPFRHQWQSTFFFFLLEVLHEYIEEHKESLLRGKNHF